MRVNNLTSGNIKQAVWGNSIRTLTNDPSATLVDAVASISVVSAAVQGAFGAYVTVNPALAHTGRGFWINIIGAVPKIIDLEFASGSAGNEVVFKSLHIAPGVANQVLVLGEFNVDVSLLVKGQRISCHIANATDAVQVTYQVNITFKQAND